MDFSLANRNSVRYTRVLNLLRWPISRRRANSMIAHAVLAPAPSPPHCSLDTRTACLTLLTSDRKVFTVRLSLHGSAPGRKHPCPPAPRPRWRVGCPPWRRWLRHTWLSRLPLLERGRAWFERPRTSRAGAALAAAATATRAGVPERRWSPNDPLGIIQVPLLWGGMALLPGPVVSPLRVLVHGWPDGVAPSAPLDGQGQVQTAPSAAEKPLSDEDIEALFAPGAGRYGKPRTAMQPATTAGRQAGRRVRPRRWRTPIASF